MTRVMSSNVIIPSNVETEPNLRLSRASRGCRERNDHVARWRCESRGHRRHSRVVDRRGTGITQTGFREARRFQRAPAIREHRERKAFRGRIPRFAEIVMIGCRTIDDVLACRGLTGV